MSETTTTDDLNARAWALREHLGDFWPRGLVRDRMAEKDCWALGGTYIHDVTAHALIGWAAEEWIELACIQLVGGIANWGVFSSDGQWCAVLIPFEGEQREIGTFPTRFAAVFAAVLSAAEAVVAANQNQESK